MKEEIAIIKDNIVKKIKKIQNEMSKSKIDSENYNDMLEDILFNKRELILIDKFQNGQLKFIDIKKTYDKYNELSQLSKKSIKDLVKILSNYKNKISFFREYEKTIEFPKSMNNVKKEANQNSISTDRIKAKKELENLYEFIFSKKEDFEEIATKLKSRIRIIDKEAYNELYNNQHNKTHTKIETLKKLENIDNEKNIIEILNLYKEKKSLKYKLIKLKNNEKKLDEINKRIINIEKLRLKNIDLYLSFNYDLFKQKLNINLNQNNYDNKVNVIFDIYNEIVKTRKDYEKVLKNIKSEHVLMSTCDKQIVINKKQLQIDMINLTKQININIDDYENLTETEINNIIAQITLYKYLLNCYEKKDEIKKKL